MTAPRLSVVVPTHDTRELTLRCLASLAGCEVEIVVVDDGSTDGTADAIRERHPAARIVGLTPAHGFTAAANRGMGEAHGDRLFLLNSDTEVAPDTVEQLLAAFESNPRLGVAGAELHFADGRPQWSAGRSPTPLWLFAQASGIVGVLERLPGYRRLRPAGGARDRADWVCGAAMMIRRDVWRAVGGFDERFHFYCQDLDLCLRAADAGFAVEVVPGARVMHRAGATIGRREGAVSARYHPGLLWTDLVRWAAKREGPRRARDTARLLRLGGALRVGARRLAVPFVAADRRATWRRETRAFEHALAALGQERRPR